jgi:hypothetical protein
MKRALSTYLLVFLFLASLAVTSAIETINVLVVLVQWKDHASRPLISRDKISQMWNGPSNSITVPGECISDYIESNSYGKYRIQADVLDWYRVPQTEAEASFGNMGNSPTAAGPDIEDILLPVLEAAVNAGLVDLSRYADKDNNLKGVVSQILLIDALQYFLDFSHYVSCFSLLSVFSV